MSGGFEAKNPGEAFKKMGDCLMDVADGARGSRNLVRGMVADPGMFGVFLGQAMGGPASKACDDAGDGFDKFGESLEKTKEKLDKAKQAYEDQDQSVKDGMKKFEL